MITCIVIDDEPMALDVLERYCDREGRLQLKGTFLEPLEAAEYLRTSPVDLVFLDINMPVISGLQLVKTLPGSSLIVFTTAYSHYAVESYNLEAADYLLKPITFERFQRAVDKAAAGLTSKNETNVNEGPTVLLKSGPQTYPVKLSEILYLEKDGNYFVVHLKNRNILIRENMNEVFNLIPDSEFARVHKSYIVAVRHIAMIETNHVTVNGVKIPLGHTYRDGLRDRLSGKKNNV